MARTTTIDYDATASISFFEITVGIIRKISNIIINFVLQQIGCFGSQIFNFCIVGLFYLGSFAGFRTFFGEEIDGILEGSHYSSIYIIVGQIGEDVVGNVVDQTRDVQQFWRPAARAYAGRRGYK